jgi:hypothetical protein
MATTLARILEIPDNLAPLDAQLAADAFNKLGYAPGHAAISATKDQRRLLTGLLDIGIHPFTEAAVARYKAAQLHAKWYRMFLWQSTSIPLALLGVACLQRGPGWFAVLALALLVGALIVGFVPMFHFQPINWEWRRVPIRAYDLPIPSHVLATALLIQNKFHNVSTHEFGMTIDVMRADAETRDPDPFLVVTLGSASAYVEVWDEPSFTPKAS